MSSIAEYVDRGVDWLNENHPGWLDKINLERLDLSNGSDCVLGQVVGNGIMGWYPVLTKARLGSDRAAELGFSITGRDSITNAQLTDAWRTRIEQLRGIREDFGAAETETETYALVVDGRRYAGTWDALLSLMKDLGPREYAITRA